jgi:hypothetical protein
MKQFALIAMLLASCGPRAIPHEGGHGDGPPPPPPPVFDLEPNDSIDTASFVSVFTPPDHLFVNGDIGTVNDQDWYHFFAPSSEIVSMVINSTNHAPIEVFIFAQDLENETSDMVAHFIGDPGELVVLNLPVGVYDNGFHVRVSSPVPVTCHYNMEIWTPGFVQ